MVIDRIESTRFFITDNLGSTVCITDNNGDILWGDNYTPFGSSAGEWGYELEEKGFFTGKFEDELTGLYYFNARWYDAKLGRFISEDPIRDGLNWLVYANNNPLKFVDPTGLEKEKKIDFNPKSNDSKSELNNQTKEMENNADKFRDDVLANPQKYNSSNSGQDPDAPMPVNIDNLIFLQDEAMTHSNYQEGSGGPYQKDYGGDDTWCAHSTYAIAEATGFNTDLIKGDGSSLESTWSGSAYNNMLNAASDGKLSELSAKDAQTRANQGYTVIAAIPSHLSTVRPGNMYNETHGPMVAHIGGSGNMERRVRSSFLASNQPNVKYFMDPKQDFSVFKPELIGEKLYK